MFFCSVCAPRTHVAETVRVSKPPQIDYRNADIPLYPEENENESAHQYEEEEARQQERQRQEQEAELLRLEEQIRQAREEAEERRQQCEREEAEEQMRREREEAEERMRREREREEAEERMRREREEAEERKRHELKEAQEKSCREEAARRDSAWKAEADQLAWEMERKTLVATFLKEHGYSDVITPKRTVLKTKYPIHTAAKAGDPTIVSALIKLGADPGQKDSSGHTAAQVAQLRNKNGSHNNVLRALGGA